MQNTHEFFTKMKTAERIEIFKNECSRLKELIKTYSVYDKKDLQDSVMRIKKRLGPQRTKKAIEAIKNEDWEGVCKSVLEYYDKCYEYEKIGKKNIKTLDLKNEIDDEKTLKLIKEFMKS